MRRIAVVVITLAGLAGNVAATPLTVGNASFESATLPLIGNGTFSQLISGSTIFASGGTLDTWIPGTNTQNAAVGAFAPSPGGNNWTSIWWQGNNIAYIQLSSPGVASLLQPLADTLQNNTTYTLSVDIGRRSFTPNFSYSIDLYAGTTLLSTSSDLSLAPNSFGTDTVVYSTGTNNALAGQNLGIVLAGFTGLSGFTEVFFDNVRLEAVSHAAVPEPGTILLVVSGLTLLITRRTWINRAS